MQRFKSFLSEASYQDDPRWITAKYDGTDKKGNKYKKGEEIFYYPRTKTILAGKDAEQASRDFDAAKADDSMYESTDMSDSEICDLYDANPNMTLQQLSAKTGKSVAELKKILMHESVLIEANLSNTEKTLLGKIASAIKGTPLLSIGPILEKIPEFKRTVFLFKTDPIPSWHAVYNGNTIVILNKKYVDGPDVEVGDIAIGILR